MQELAYYYHLILAYLGGLIYGWPSRRIFVLGVTGTKGKSTVLELINAVLERAGKKTALLSSIRIKIGEKSEKNMTGNTMPGRFFIQRFLRKARKRGCEYALIEVTSQGVLQHRHRFIDWDAALITNLSPEHIEAHGSYENYCRAKISFFDRVAESLKPEKHFIINEDVAHLDDFLRAADGKGKIHYFSREIFLRNYLGRSYDLSSGKDQRRISDWLLADFNMENAAAATVFARAVGIDWDIIREALENFRGVAGRMEFVRRHPFSVLIDYAHTPDSLAKVYQYFNGIAKKRNKLICVLGAAGGGRDKWKRPEMGRIAAEYCREIILTNEDPYDENPSQILSEIKSGISKIQFPISKVHEILDRREAIKKAVSLAKKGDAVVITGKGSESWIHVSGGKKIPWDERLAVEETLAGRN